MLNDADIVILSCGGSLFEGIEKLENPERAKRMIDKVIEDYEA